MESEILKIFQKIVTEACNKNIKIVTAESCTGGLISAYITSVSGSSEVFERGFVTYSNKAKAEILEVNKTSLNQFGAVSNQVAKEMAEGCLKNSDSDIAVSVTGIAGPSGGSDEKPVGLVYIGLNNNGKIKIEKNIFSGDRQEVRLKSVKRAAEMILKEVELYEYQNK